MIGIDILCHSFSTALTTKVPYIDITSGDVMCYFILSMLDLVRPMHENDSLTSQVITKSRIVIFCIFHVHGLSKQNHRDVTYI